MKRIIALTMAAVLLFALCPADLTGLRADAAALPADGEYTLFTTEYLGRQISPEAWQTSGSIVLNKNGKGMYYSFGEELAITSWMEKNGTVTANIEDFGPVELVFVGDGILEMEQTTGTYYYYARAGADTEKFKTGGHPTGSMLYSVFRGIDMEKGAHLRYSSESKYSNAGMNSSASFETHAKGDSFIVISRAKAQGADQLSAMLTLNGTVYQLSPSEKKGFVVIPSMPAFSLLKVMEQDGLYRAMASRAMRTDYRVETRKLNGANCRVEVFPAADYSPEAAFYFDESGQLVCMSEGSSQGMSSGETFYTVSAIDDKVNESLFDVSSYKIS
ncbi:MAG: hypothetical protein K6F56_05470 [Oscillospiraceae bacterium]|nr:hypothetical protein [Oscillospiraceae bacterium]